MSVINKKARFDYEIIETYEAGIVLTGSEVKSVRSGSVNFSGSRVVFVDGKVKLLGLNINKYKYDSSEDYEPAKVRELLLNRSEIVEIQAKSKASGLTLVPIKLYNKGSLIKLQIALVRGKKKFEKRAEIKKRDIDRGLARRLKK